MQRAGTIGCPIEGVPGSSDSRANIQSNSFLVAEYRDLACDFHPGMLTTNRNGRKNCGTPKMPRFVPSTMKWHSPKKLLENDSEGMDGTSVIVSRK